MLRRFLLRSSILAGILLACFAHLVWNGRHALKVVAENLPHPDLSTGKRDIDLWVPTVAPGRLYDLTFVLGETPKETLPPGTRLKLQLASSGRTRLLVVRPGHPKTDVSWWSLLAGREKLQIVADRDWIDLGPAPAPGETLEVQVSGMLPGPYGFAQLLAPKWPHFKRILAVRPESPRARPTHTTLRYRFDRIEPVPAQETLARFFFFISCSRVLQIAGIAALGLLFAGWWWLWEGRVTRAVACLVPAVTLLHACCLPPFQGADEIAHEATVETLLFNPAALGGPSSFPKSLAQLHDAIGYDRFAGDPETPLPIDSPERRSAVARTLEARLATEASSAGPPTRDGRVLDPRTRASLYYNGYRPLAPVLRTLSVLDRVEGYVVVSAFASLLFFIAGVLFLSRSGMAGSMQLAFGLIALVPYSVGVAASCSNYSLAIGMGQSLAACLVVGVLTASTRRRLLAAALFVAVSTVGIAVWDDFVFFAVPGVLALAILAIQSASRMPEGPRRRIATAAMTSLGVLLVVALALAVATGRIRQAISSFGGRLPRDLGGFEDPSLWLLLAVAAFPMVVSLVLAFAVIRSRGLSDRIARRSALARTAVLATLFFVMFCLTRWRSVPFEHYRPDYPDEVAAHLAAFWSNNFAFDQDVLSWKMYWGVFGYADVSYPDVVYALARWACVALFLALPVLSRRFTRQNAGGSALLLVFSGYAIAVCVVTNSLRYFVPTNPWGRFILPALPLAALPLLARAAGAERERALRVAVGILVALHVWTAIGLLGTRYAIGV